MNPTWYDILGVSPDADADEIKRAWRSSADRFEPGSGGAAQFRLFNEAAEVLLDPARRRVYDEELAKASSVDVSPSTRDFDEADLPAADVDAAREPTWTATPTISETAELSEKASGSTRRAAPIGLIAALAVLAFALIAAAAWVGLPALDTVRAAERYDAAAQSAPAAAERAAPDILSYSYKSLDADKSSAVRHMTDKSRKEYTETFETLVRENAEKLRADVQAKVSASAVSEASGERANVLVFVNQSTTSKANNGEPQVALNRVMFAMVKQGDRWLVDDITAF